MTTKTKLAPMTIKVENNKVLCNKNGNKFIDLLGDLYVCMNLITLPPNQIGNIQLSEIHSQ